MNYWEDHDIEELGEIDPFTEAPTPEIPQDQTKLALDLFNRQIDLLNHLMRKHHD